MLAVPVVIAVAIIAGFIVLPSLQQQQEEPDQKSLFVFRTLIPLKVSELAKDSTHVVIGTVTDISAGPARYDGDIRR